MYKFRKRWLGFILLLFVLSFDGATSMKSQESCVTKITFHGCDLQALKQEGKLLHIFTEEFKKSECDALILSLDLGSYISVHCKEGYAVMMILPEKKKITVSIISSEPYTMENLIDNFQTCLGCESFTIE